MNQSELSGSSSSDGEPQVLHLKTKGFYKLQQSLQTQERTKRQPQQHDQQRLQQQRQQQWNESIRLQQTRYQNQPPPNYSCQSEPDDNPPPIKIEYKLKSHSGQATPPAPPPTPHIERTPSNFGILPNGLYGSFEPPQSSSANQKEYNSTDSESSEGEHENTYCHYWDKVNRGYERRRKRISGINSQQNTDKKSSERYGPRQKEYNSPNQKEHIGPDQREYNGPDQKDYNGPDQKEYTGPNQKEYNSPDQNEYDESYEGPGRAIYRHYWQQTVRSINHRGLNLILGFTAAQNRDRRVVMKASRKMPVIN